MYSVNKIILLTNERKEKRMAELYEIEQKGGESTIASVCPKCKKVSYIEVKSKDILWWKNGAMVQTAFSYLSADQREMLLSGLCTECWNKLFKED